MIGIGDVVIFLVIIAMIIYDFGYEWFIGWFYCWGIVVWQNNEWLL